MQSQNPAESAYQIFLKIDAHIGGILSNPPEWLSPTSTISKMPYFEVRHAVCRTCTSATDVARLAVHAKHVSHRGAAQAALDPPPLHAQALQR